MTIDNGHNELDNISFLLDYCSKNVELYNEVANHLHERFNIKSAELCLLVTYYLAEDRRKHDSKI